MARTVLDASALLVLLHDEPGKEQVAAVIPDGVVSSVNLAEVVGKLTEAGMPAAAVRAALEGFDLEVTPLDEEQAYAAGLLRGPTKRAGLSLGDRACLALAAHLELPALTTDRAWRRVKVDAKVRVVTGR